MSKDTRFKPGQSGNPKGRPPKPRRPNISAFEIVLDKRLVATVGGKERELTVEEVLQQQTLKDALAGKRMAIRKVLKMIEKREAALAKKTSLPMIEEAVKLFPISMREILEKSITDLTQLTSIFFHPSNPGYC